MRYAVDELKKTCSLVWRKDDFLFEEAYVAEAEESDESVGPEYDDSEGSGGSFEPDSEDEKFLRRDVTAGDPDRPSATEAIKVSFRRRCLLLRQDSGQLLS
jgi:hypothetical protein